MTRQFTGQHNGFPWLPSTSSSQVVCARVIGYDIDLDLLCGIVFAIAKYLVAKINTKTKQTPISP